MKDYGIGRLLIAALTVGMLGLPYAKPAVCAMGGQEAMSSECDECDESAPNEGDDLRRICRQLHGGDRPERSCAGGCSDPPDFRPARVAYP